LPIIPTFQSITSDKTKEQLNITEGGRNVSGVRTAALEKLAKISREPNSNFINTNYTTNKSLSLKQLKEVIDEIYESKLKFDEKNYQGKLAR
jgi:hypothetical protein